MVRIFSPLFSVATFLIMASESYQRQLPNPLWQKKRLEIFNRDNFTCRRCGEKTKELHVHHQYYLPDKQAWEYPDVCFLTLCHDCHRIEEEYKHYINRIKKEIEASKNFDDGSVGVVTGADITKRRYRDARVISTMKKAQEYFPYLCHYIEQCEDHKGHLDVWWKVPPSKEQKEAIEKAWEDHHETIIEHHLPQDIFGDTFN